MFALNGTCVIFIFLFLVFIHLLNEILLKPLGRVIEERAANLQANLEVAKTSTQEAERILKDYQTKLHTTRLEAQSVIQNALAQVKSERDNTVKGIQAEGRTKLDALKAELTANRQNVLQSLVQPELELVRDIIGKLLGEAPTLVISEERVFQILEETR